MFCFSLHTPIISFRDSLPYIIMVLIQDKFIHVDTNVLRLRESERKSNKKDWNHTITDSPFDSQQSTNKV